MGEHEAHSAALRARPARAQRGFGVPCEPMEGSIEARVSHEVDLWLRWLPKWQPGTHRARMRLCRSCFGSPIVRAAGLDADVPHAVQHGMSMRMKLIIDASVDDYTDRNLPLLHHELVQTELRKRAQQYQPLEGLEPEAIGLELDPEPEDDQPFLFTFGELVASSAPDAAGVPSAVVHASEPPVAVPEELAPLSDEEKQALRVEMKLADDFATHVGRRVCAELLHHRERITAAVAEYVEPQVAALLADLERELDSPLWPNS